MTAQKESGQVVLLEFLETPDKRAATQRGIPISSDSILDALRSVGVASIPNERKTTHQFTPDTSVFELAALLTSSGIGMAIYKSIQLWVDSRNGRRFRVKLKDVEIETTQMSQAAFLQLVELLLEMDNEKTANLSDSESTEKERVRALRRHFGKAAVSVPTADNHLPSAEAVLEQSAPDP